MIVQLILELWRSPEIEKKVLPRANAAADEWLIGILDTIALLRKSS